MKKIWVIGVVIYVYGCSSTHPIMEANPIDIATSQPVEQVIPEELVEALGWGVLSDPAQEKVNEEFRVSFSSASIPYHLFRIQNEKKIQGAIVLYWPKSRNVRHTVTPEQNMEVFLAGTCDEILETELYEYCHPELRVEPNWGRLYEVLVSNQIWTLPTAEEIEPVEEESSNPWEMSLETRYQNYYRSMTHSNVDKYQRGEHKLHLLATSAQLQLIAESVSPAANYNIYQGVTNGLRGADFYPCGSDEVWRFNGDLSKTMSESGMAIEIEGQDSLLFFINITGHLQDEWYALRESTGYSKLIFPTSINNLELVHSTECPVTK